MALVPDVGRADGRAEHVAVGRLQAVQALQLHQTPQLQAARHAGAQTAAVEALQPLTGVARLDLPYLPTSPARGPQRRPTAVRSIMSEGICSYGQADGMVFTEF